MGMLGCAHETGYAATVGTSFEPSLSSEILKKQLDGIWLDRYRVEDVPLEVVLESLEKTFQAYRSSTTNSTRGLTKTLFRVHASKALLRQRVTFQTGEHGSSLWRCIGILSCDACGVAKTRLPERYKDGVVLEGICFPIESGQIVVRDAAFAESDIRNLVALAARLKNERQGVSQYLRTMLGAETLKALSEYQGTGPNDKELKSALVEQINVMVEEGPIYDVRRFAGVSLSLETRKMLGKKARGEALVRLNRMLLEDAYPDELAKRGAGGQNSKEKREP